MSIIDTRGKKMSNILKELADKGLVKPPSWLANNVHYLTIMGSQAYAVSNKESDFDLYAMVIPPKEDLFVHLKGEIIGFGAWEDDKIHKNRWRTWQQAHVFDPSALGGKGREYDFQAYNIVDYFQLCADSNPNMIDSLFTSESNVLHTTKIGQMVKDNRRLFLTKKCYHTFRGYAQKQLKKARNTGAECPKIQAIRKFEDDHGISHTMTFEAVKAEMIEKTNPELANLSQLELNEYLTMFTAGMTESKRFESRKTFNVDVKFLYHLARLADECEQILELGDVDLQRSREYMKAIRRGDVSEKDLTEWYTVRDKNLEALYGSSKLPNSPNMQAIKTLLFQCLEEHYGDLNIGVARQEREALALVEIKAVLEKYNLQ